MNEFNRFFLGTRLLRALPLTLCLVLGWASTALALDAVNPARMAASADMVVPPPPPPRIPFAPRPGKPVPDLPVFQKLSPGVYGLGDIEISKAARSVSFPVLVNMNKGPLEYLLVRTGGKTHESLFRTHIDPTQIQMALLLIGLEGTDHPLTRQGDPDIPRGDAVEVKAHYLKNGRMVPVQPEDWVSKKVAGKLANSEPLQWVFTGSAFSNGKFMAQAEGSVIAIYRDPFALINNAAPGGESDRIWFVNEDSVPPVGTPVTLTIRVKQ